VGGIAEMFMQHPEREQLKLKDRKGFVRVAVEQVRRACVGRVCMGWGTVKQGNGGASLE
jgi:hypothetical protein